MNHSRLNDLLNLWAKSIINEITESGYKKATAEWRIWRGGSFIIYTPNYWPCPEARILNEYITQLPIRLRNTLVVYYCMKYDNITRMAEECHCSRNTFKKRFEQAKDKLINNLQGVI